MQNDDYSIYSGPNPIFDPIRDTRFDFSTRGSRVRKAIITPFTLFLQYDRFADNAGAPEASAVSHLPAEESV